MTHYAKWTTEEADEIDWIAGHNQTVLGRSTMVHRFSGPSCGAAINCLSTGDYDCDTKRVTCEACILIEFAKEAEKQCQNSGGKGSAARKSSKKKAGGTASTMTP